MASIRELEPHNGVRRFEIRVHPQRGRAISRTWRCPQSWSGRTVERELAKFAAELERGVKNGTIQTRTERKAAELQAMARMSFREYAEMVWLPEIISRSAAATVSTYRRVLKLRLYPPFGDRMINEITAAAINREVVAWSGVIAFKTANLSFSVLKSILRNAFLDGTVSTDLSAKIRPPRRQKDDTPQLEAALSLEQLRLVLQAAENEENPWRTLLHLAAETGARVGEICALRWNDIAKDGTISINGSMSGTERKSTKTGATREVTISPDTLRRLQGMRGQTNSIYIFATQSGAPMNQPAISRFMKKFSARLVEQYPNAFPQDFHLHIHLLRHTAAVVAQQQGISAVDTAVLLGHSSPETTLRIYSRADASAARTAGDAIQRAIAAGKLG
ncbi:MAG: site-specific integrase [Oscillospiraceae bacterium]|nr:site-specific integrase [Oscillospiraceae bacterium]